MSGLGRTTELTTEYEWDGEVSRAVRSPEEGRCLRHHRRDRPGAVSMGVNPADTGGRVRETRG